MVRGNFWKFGSFTIGQKFSHLTEFDYLVYIHIKPVYTRSLFIRYDMIYMTRYDMICYMICYVI